MSTTKRIDDDALDGLQPDIYQRYELLRQLIGGARRSMGEGRVRVLDVGSGPDRLTELALGDDFDVIRADTLDIDDPTVVRLFPGTALPFDDDSFDVVLALDVLEHVPAGLRDGFIDDCSRVASHLVVVACPVRDDGVEQAERVLGELMEHLSGSPVAFLEEHAAHGLPDEQTTAALMARRCRDVAIAPNAPLVSWATANIIDFVVNLRLGDGWYKRRVNAELNRGSVVCPATAPAYRRFFVGSPAGTIDVGELVDSLRSSEPVLDGAELTARAALVLTERMKPPQRAAAEFASASDTFGTGDDVARRAVEFQIEVQRIRAHEAERTSNQLRRALSSLREQLDSSREALTAARSEYDALLVDALRQPSAAPPEPVAPPLHAAPTVRTVAARARRAPRWLARKVRNRLRSVVRQTPAVPPSGVAVDEAAAPDAAPSEFDAQWYDATNPGVRAAGMDPWAHYRSQGRFEGRSPHPLFDPWWYSATYPDVLGREHEAFDDWVASARSERRNPNQYFEADWYLARYPEVAAAGLDPVQHYCDSGWKEGRQPGPLFDPAWYLAGYPDVADGGIEPLAHFLRYGRGEGRVANQLERNAQLGSYRPPAGLIPWFNPVNFRLLPDAAASPRLNVLLPGMGVRHLTGGPNTAIQLGYRLAATGIAVRFIATDAPLDDDTGPLWEHMAAISGVGRRLANVEVVDGSNRHRAVAIGENDLFLATAWWTAQSVKSALPLVRQQRFLYLIQDFEPLFFASSSQYALALETYDLDHLPIVNSQFLLDHLVEERVGRFADTEFAATAIVFEPAVDRTLFRPRVPTTASRRRRLLFYARPQNGLRNLFELGVAAIQLAVQHGVFHEDEWEFCGMGEHFDPVAVGPRSVLRPVPWRDLDGYADQMRDSDVLLSLMLAPHPSYPPLEMAACGGVAVTCEFGPKTAERLAAISPNIIATPATIEGVAEGLQRAVAHSGDLRALLDGTNLSLPMTWDDAFADVVPELHVRLDELAQLDAPAPARAPIVLSDRYGSWLERRAAARAREYPAPTLPDPGPTFSLITAVWNTPREFLRELADSVLAQDLPESWEWVITDNGSTDAGTLAVLEQLAGHPSIRVTHAESNRGILGGMRACLEQSTGRYIVHLDHDDLLSPDALRVVAACLARAEWPTAFYSDEDKLRGGRRVEPYLKPDWDPVLFTSSCYVAHLCGVDRELALRLDAYLDPYTEASPDWDLFMRLLVDGHEPLHVPEVLYSWRVHSASTAGDPTVKPYAVNTHRRVLERFVSARAGFDRFSIEIHPDSPDRLDWWIRRRHIAPTPIVTVVLGDSTAPPIARVPLVDQQILSLASSDDAEFERVAERAVAEGRLVHIVSGSARLLRDEWYWEALGILELHPDAIAVGGRIVGHERLISAGDVFGFGSGCDSPAAGEPHDARGWFTHNLKQRSVDAVPTDHMVVRPEALLEAIREFGGELTAASAGVAVGLLAHRRGRRIVYSPMLRAEVDRPLSDSVGTRERVVAGRACALAASSRHRSRWLSLQPGHPDEPVDDDERRDALIRLTERALPPERSYHDWFEIHLERRHRDHPLPTDPASISVITPVYSGTDAALFESLHASLSGQTHRYCNWIIGLDGDIDDALDAALTKLRRNDRRVIVVGDGTKRGILGTMRLCLEAADGDYFVPVDADDVLTPDALAILAHVIEANGTPGLVHSDEDVLDGDTLRDPFLRPAWDPALHLAGSYVWHALCIRTDLARAVGLYDDPTYEWCHDWDTVDRVRRAGETIVHVPEVLYHWRRHDRSSTNTDVPEIRQQQSVVGMFERLARDTGHPDRYEVTEFPLWRGATEFHLRRRRHDAPDVTLLSIGPLTAVTESNIVVVNSLPFAAVRELTTLNATIEEFTDELESIESPLVVMLDSTLVLGPGEPFWEAVKWFELLPDVAAVCGRLVGPDGRVLSGAEVQDPDDGGYLRPLVGRGVEDPGPYAMALKPHTIDVVDPGLCVADVAVMRAAASSIDPFELVRTAGARLGTSISEQGRRLVYTPLLSALTDRSTTIASDQPVAPTRHGLSAFMAGSRRFA